MMPFWGVNPSRTPENQPICPIRNPEKILTFETYVCANLGKFGVNFGMMYERNPGNTLGLDLGMIHNPGKIWAPDGSNAYVTCGKASISAYQIGLQSNVL